MTLKVNEVNGETQKLSLPNWVVSALITLVIALGVNLGTTAYWAGKMTAQQEFHAQQLRELKDDIQADFQHLRTQVERLNERTSKN